MLSPRSGRPPRGFQQEQVLTRGELAGLAANTGHQALNLEEVMISISGKRVVITGAASGFGRSLALALADRGCRIGIADINVDGALATLEMVEKRKGSGEVYPLDVVKPEEV